jgi:FAD/FMN-containing dehydrogenase
MSDASVLSWNRWPRVEHRSIFTVTDRIASLPATDCSLLPFGNGRSYGDVCLNPAGALLRTRRLDHFMTFDAARGTLTCEAGVLLGDILRLIVPRGWFLPVTPGTRFVTVGGAIANDVHGKSHHVAGSFGHHIECFELLRSDGSRRLCSPQQNEAWFRATIGGLGLTGLVTWAELRLLPIANPWMLAVSERFSSLAQFWQLNHAAEAEWSYTVAWIDCAAGGSGRGILMKARHAPPADALPAWRERQHRFPFDLPVSLVNRLSLRAFNMLYYHRPLPVGTVLTHHLPYFYPLDSLLDWNRLYGRRGFFQYQCVLPPQTSETGITELLKQIARSGAGSFLAVLKTFGDMPPAGLLSFARRGATLALDFPNHGERTLALFRELDAVVVANGGALYPAKDARMSAKMFQSSFPRWQEFAAFIDPRFSSGFWRRAGDPA